MTYAQLIKRLFDESGLQVKDYAERVGYSTTQMSNVLNGSEDGTLKMVVQCLKFAQKDIQDYLCTPGERTTLETGLIDKLLYILRNDPLGHQGIRVNIDYIYEEARRRVRRVKKEAGSGLSPPSGHSPRKPRSA